MSLQNIFDALGMLMYVCGVTMLIVGVAYGVLRLTAEIWHN